MQNILVKICGLTSESDVTSAVAAGANFIGCVFYPNSPRHVEPAHAYDITSNIEDAKKVAVVVDPSEALLDDIIHVFKPHYVQLHGSETEADILHIKQKYKVGVIKAIKVSSGDDIAKSLSYFDVADMVLFDAKAPKNQGMLPGGNGLSFDWQLLAHRNFNKTWFLSGGLSVDNVEEALSVTGAQAVDVSSGVESSPGGKDHVLMNMFIEKIRTI